MRLSALLLCLLAPAGAAQGADHLIGRPHAGLPGGWGEVAGLLLPDRADGPGYTLSLYGQVDRGAPPPTSWLMVYSRIDSLVSGRYPISTVLAALRIEIESGEEVVWPGCLPGRDVVAVAGAFQNGDETEDPFWGPVRLAWELDREGVAFRPIDVAGIVCQAVETD